MTLSKDRHHEEGKNVFFILLADPQFGMFPKVSGMDEAGIERHRQAGMKIRPAPKITGFPEETARYEIAIECANRLKPDFVVMCGDMIDSRDEPDQLVEVLRITGKLDKQIPMYWVPGNHDIASAPTSETLARYRQTYGDDRYCFDHFGSRFIVLNSPLLNDCSHVPEEGQEQIDFLKAALRGGRDKQSNHIIVFSHHALFVKQPDEPDSTWAIRGKSRPVVFSLLKEHNVSAVFSGHWHRNNYASDGDLEVVMTGPVGYPLGDDPSGLRIVKVFQDRIDHEYFALDALPETVEIPVALPPEPNRAKP